MRIVGIKKACPPRHRVVEERGVDGATPGGIRMGSFGACLPYLTPSS